MKKGEKGYSLIEVLAAFAIISIAILPIMSMYPAIFKQNKSASEIEEASRIALTIVDYIKARGYEDLESNRLVAKFTDNNRNRYLLTPVSAGDNSGSFQIESNQLDVDLGFNTAAGGVIFLNSKGLTLRDNGTVISVKMNRTNVNLPSGTTFIDPITTSTTSIMYGANTRQFIAGRVVIGWGNDITGTTGTSRQELDKNAVLKEKAYGVDFIITPKLSE